MKHTIKVQRKFCDIQEADVEVDVPEWASQQNILDLALSRARNDLSVVWDNLEVTSDVTYEVKGYRDLEPAEPQCKHANTEETGSFWGSGTPVLHCKDCGKTF